MRVGAVKIGTVQLRCHFSLCPAREGERAEWGTSSLDSRLPAGLFGFAFACEGVGEKKLKK